MREKRYAMKLNQSLRTQKSRLAFYDGLGLWQQKRQRLGHGVLVTTATRIQADRVPSPLLGVRI
jgi:hypothetical protein